MSSNQIINAAPMAVLLGIQDDSTQAVSVTPQAVPSHCPLVYLYTQKGRSTRQLVAGAGLNQAFGANSFDLRQPWATHATVLSNVFSAAGNAQMIERLTPVDAPLKSNFTLWLDVLASPVPVYQRNSDGSYVLNSTTGLPVPVSPAQTTLGYHLKWVINSLTSGLATDADSVNFGNLSSVTGDQTDGQGNTSTRFPILQFWADSFGSYANNAGFRLWAPVAGDDVPVNSQVLSKSSVYPFRLAAISRVDSTSTATIKSMLTGDSSFEFTFQPGVINPYTNAQYSLGDVFPSAYQAINQAGFDPIYADLSGLYIYQNYINSITAQIYATERAVGGTGSDFNSSATTEQWKVNFVNAKSSSGIPYHSVVMNTTDANALVLTESTNLWAAGGGDGTMNNVNFASLVSSAIATYSDPTSEILDTAVNVESIFYDSGFPLQTKEDLCQFISQRSDTFIVLSTYTVGGPELQESDEAAIGATLRTRLQLYPESTNFGTPTARGLVMARYGNMLNTQFSGKLPITLELAAKSAAFMGASNGTWNKTYLFDKSPQSELTLFSNLNVTFVPGQQRNLDWANGLNYPLSFSRDSMFFAALKTVYPDDTSVLTSYFTVLACCQLQKVGQQVWREFSGEISLTEAQLIARVNQSVVDKTAGKFAGLFVIKPQATITQSDSQRGYSYTLPIQIYGNVSKTVSTVYVQAYRQSSLPTT